MHSSASKGLSGRDVPRRLVRQVLEHRRAVLTIVLVLGPLLIVAAVVRDVSRARILVAGAFHQDATKVFATLREEVKECVNTAASVADMMRTFGPIDQERFAVFVRPHLGRATGLVALLWVPRVPDRRRRDFETSGRMRLGPDFTIVEREERSGITRAARSRSEYFPVYYRESLQGTEVPPGVGTDLGAVPAGLDALRRARDSGEPVMTSALPTTQGRWLHVYWAVYRRDMAHERVADRREALLGYVGAVFRLDGVMAYCLRQSMPGGFDITLVDEDAPPEDRILSYPAPQAVQAAGFAHGSRLLESMIGLPLHWSDGVEVAGRHWRLAVTPTPAYIAAKIPGDIWQAALVRLVFVALISAYLLLLIRRNDDVERLVVSRTNELQRAHDQLVAEVAERTRAEATARKLTRRVLSVQEDERRRLSRELHDEAGQSLTALVMQLRLMRDDAPDDQPRMKERLAAAEAMAQAAMENIRSTARDLRPPALDTLGVTASLRGLCEDVGHWANLTITFAAMDVPPLPEMIAICLYRVLQEALTNAAKYAGATRVDVALEGSNPFVVLSVEDDGLGFDAVEVPGGGRPHGVGLIGMRERLELIGGSISIASRPGRGTRLVARVPLAAAEHPGTEQS